MNSPDAATIEALVVSAVTLPVLLALWCVFVSARGLAFAGAVAAAPALLLGFAMPAAGIEVRVDWLLLGARFGIDAHTASFALLTGALWAAASIACAGYFDVDARRRIAPWWLLSLAGSVGLVLALDPVTYFLFFALMSFASYGLVVHRADAAAFRAGRIYMGYVVAGEVCLFAGLVLARTHPGVAAALVLVGFGIKAGALFLHSWLPLAHTAAPAPASAVLSGAMLKAGLLGWLRFVDVHAPWAEAAGLGLVALGIAGAYAGALVGIAQRQPKAVLAYSSVSQMGIAIAAFGMLLAGDVNAPAAAACALFAVHHGLAKGALFIGVGAIERLSGGARRAGLAMMSLAALSLIGAPFTSGAVAKADIKALAAGLPEAWASVLDWALPLTALGTTLLMLRLFATLEPARPGRCPASLWMPATALVMAGFVLVVVSGSVPPSSTSLAGALAALVPVAVAAALVAAWRWLARRFGVTGVPIPSGDLVVAIEAGARRVRRLATGAGAPPVREINDGGSEAGAATAIVSRRLEGTLAGAGASAGIALALVVLLGLVLLISG